jgi:beta-galactosidase
VWEDGSHAQFMGEFEAMIDALENHPCIVVWVPFNEAWGQHRTVDVAAWAMARDPTRLVNAASGGNFWPVGHMADNHNYPNPTFPFYLPDRPDLDQPLQVKQHGCGDRFLSCAGVPVTPTSRR